MKLVNKNENKNLLVGEKVLVIGKSGIFRYVKKNIVRSVKTGRVYSVKYYQIISKDFLLTVKCRIILIAISSMYILFLARIIQLLIIKN